MHLAIMASITAGCFQGYLKYRFAGPIPYLLADALFLGAVLLWLGEMAITRAPLRSPGRLAAVLVASIALPTLYLMHPGATLVVAAAGLRAWILFPIGCLLALHVIRTPGQVRAYVGLILILAVTTALYGIAQYRAGPEAELARTLFGRERMGTALRYLVQSTGTADFRAFSTFTFPAPFASMMVFGLLLAAGIILSPRRPAWQRWLCVLGAPVMFLGMTVSGTRAALVILAVGLLLATWLRRLGLRQLLLVPVLLVGVQLAATVTAGRFFARFGTLGTSEGRLWSYVSAPIETAWNAILANPFGMGLGRTGVGVPFAVTQGAPQGYFVFSDGDIGRAAVEMGVLGVLMLAVLLATALWHCTRACRALVGTDAEDLALGAGPLVLATGIGVIIGSPLSVAPHAVIWWFLLGALLKLRLLRQEQAASGQARAAA